MKAPIPLNEEERLKKLYEYEILDTEQEKDFDEITELASLIFDTPIALITLIDKERQWFKSNKGLKVNETHRDHAFCAHAIHQHNVFIVNDATKDDRFSDNPLVLDDPFIRFYAGAQITTPEGLILGTLCVIDNIPRELTEIQQKALEALAREIIVRFEIKKNLKENQKLLNELRIVHQKQLETEKELIKNNLAKDKLFSLLAHDLKSPFQSILGFSEILASSVDSMDKDEIVEAAKNIYQSGQEYFFLLSNLLRWARLQFGGIEIVKNKVNIKEIVEDIFKNFKVVVEEKGIVLTNETSKEDIILTEKYLFNSIILNLVSNGIKFTKSGGNLTIKTEKNIDNICLIVQDSGIGMSQDDIDKILIKNESFSKKGTNNEQGTGLGMLLINDSLIILGGSLSIKSELNKGSSFILTFPNN